MKENLYNMLIYHYCSLNTFLLIVKNKTLRLSDITKSNDSMELLWLNKYTNDILHEKYTNESTKYFRENIPPNLFEEMIETYNEVYVEELYKKAAYFVVCFSKYGDLLSQWRGYADDGRGVSIGFDANVFQGWSAPGYYDGVTYSYPIIGFDEVEYDELKQKQIVRYCTREFIKRLKFQMTRNKYRGNKNYQAVRHEKYKFPPFSKSDVEQAFNEYFFSIFSHSVYTKNPFFIEEGESRLYLKYTSEVTYNLWSSCWYLDPFVELSKIAYQPRGNIVVPYIDLSFEKTMSIIQEVTLGPKASMDVLELSQTLEDNGFGHCEVKKSKGSYR